MTTELHTLSGAYAVDALSAGEAAMFETHLHSCAACSEEVRELQAAAALMGEAESAAPPEALRARVLAAADQVPQLPPRVSSAKHKRRWLPRALGAAAAAVVLVVGTVFGLNVVNDDEPPATSVAAVFAEQDARTASVPTSNGGTLRVAMSEEAGRMAVDTDKLRELDAERVYQLWSVHNGRATSAGVINNTDEGAVLPMPAPGTTVAVTVEPDGGSDQPTSKPIAEVDPATV